MQTLGHDGFMSPAQVARSGLSPKTVYRAIRSGALRAHQPTTKYLISVKRRRDTGKWEVRWRENGRNRSKSFTLKSDAARFEVEMRRARELDRPLDLDGGRETLADFVAVYWRRYAVT